MDPYLYLAVFRSNTYENRKIVTICGNNADTVWIEALNCKNALSNGNAFEMHGLLESENVRGWWSCMLIERVGKRQRERRHARTYCSGDAS